MTEIVNDPNKRGELAGPKQLFGPRKRYAIAPVHSRFDRVAWFVWDAESPDYLAERDPVMGYQPAVIRVAATREDATEGLSLR